METREEFERGWTKRINKFMELYEMVPKGIEDDLRKSLAKVQAVVFVAANEKYQSSTPKVKNE